MATKVTIDSVATDGVNVYLEIRVSDGTYTQQTMRPSFPASITAEKIQTYVQAVATAAPSLSDAFKALVGTTFSS
jgi:hypothetical protein